VWARLFGYGEAPLRSLSALAGVATVPVVYAATRKLISGRAAVIVASLTAFNPLLIWYSQEARSYALLVLLSAGALLAFVIARERPTRAALASWAVASILALATHYYAVLAILPQAVLLLAAHRRRRSVQAAVGAVAACGLALVPLAITQLTASHSAWITQMPLRSRLAQVVPQFLAGFQAPAYVVVASVAGACAVVGILLLTRADPHERRGAIVAAGLAVAGFALILFLLAAGIDDLITRNLIVLWLPAAVVVGGGLGRRRAGLVGIAAAVVMCAAGAYSAVGVVADQDFQRPDWRSLATVLGARPAAPFRARAILIQEYGDPLPLALYLPGLKYWELEGGARFAGMGFALKAGSVAVSELDIVSASARHSTLCWWGAACELYPSRMQASYPIPGLHEVWRRRVLNFTVTRLVARSPVILTRSIVSRALRATSLLYDAVLIQR
jgi:hypothetical protein